MRSTTKPEPTQLDRIEALLTGILAALKESQRPKFEIAPSRTGYVPHADTPRAFPIPASPPAPIESDPLRSPEIRCMSMLDTLRRSFQ